MAKLTPSALQTYATHARNRQERDRQYNQERHQQGLLQASIAADILKKQFEVKDVFLFGSLLNPEWVHAASDLDLAVYGLEINYYCKALGTLLCQIKDFNVDLVRCEDAQPSLLELIQDEGIRL